MLALVLGDGELIASRLARTVRAGHGRGTEGTTGLDTRHVAEERGLVADGDVVDTVVGEEGHGGEGSSFLTTVLGTSRDKDGGKLGVLLEVYK